MHAPIRFPAGTTTCKWDSVVTCSTDSPTSTPTNTPTSAPISSDPTPAPTCAADQFTPAGGVCADARTCAVEWTGEFNEIPNHRTYDNPDLFTADNASHCRRVCAEDAGCAAYGYTENGRKCFTQPVMTGRLDPNENHSYYFKAMSGSYTAAEATMTSDRSCANTTVCGEHEYEMAAPTNTSDRVCWPEDGCQGCTRPQGRDHYRASFCLLQGGHRQHLHEA